MMSISVPSIFIAATHKNSAVRLGMPYLGANIFIHLFAGIWQNARLAALKAMFHFVLGLAYGLRQFLLCGYLNGRE